MIPEWMKQTEDYDPPKDSTIFITKSIKALSGAVSRIRIQQGHEKGRTLPPVLKVILLLALLILTAMTREKIFLLVLAVCVQGYLCTWPAKDLFAIFRTAFVAALLAGIMLFPAILFFPDGRTNNWILIGKVFLSVEILCIFNHTTQWNHITGAMRRLHVPGIFIFTLDIALKYIVLLGRMVHDLFTAMQLRSVGKNDRKQQSVGGVMGVTFLRAAQMSREMYEAMQCRGFTDDYKEL